MIKFSMAAMKPALGKNAGGQMVVLKQGNASIATPLKASEAVQIQKNLPFGPAGGPSLAVVQTSLRRQISDEFESLCSKSLEHRLSNSSYEQRLHSPPRICVCARVKGYGRKYRHGCVSRTVLKLPHSPHDLAHSSTCCRHCTAGLAWSGRPGLTCEAAQQRVCSCAAQPQCSMKEPPAALLLRHDVDRLDWDSSASNKNGSLAPLLTLHALVGVSICGAQTDAVGGMGAGWRGPPTNGEGGAHREGAAPLALTTRSRWRSCSRAVATVVECHCRCRVPLRCVAAVVECHSFVFPALSSATHLRTTTQAPSA